MSDPEIVTERLRLTPLLERDVAPLFEYRSDPVVCRYQNWEPWSLEETRCFIDDMRTAVFGTPGRWFQLAVRLRDAGTLVGDVGVHVPADEPRQAEIGFSVASAHQGRGLGTEAVRGVLRHLFGSLRKHRVFASADPRNGASLALMRRVGMRQEAHFRESLWFKGAWADDVVFAILASEWASQERGS